MKDAFLAALNRFLRGPQVSRLLAGIGVDVRRYWLLMDLFEQLGDRRGMMNQLGREGAALKVSSLIYAVMTGVMAFVFVAGDRTAPAEYLPLFLGLTAFLLLTILFSETGNSLVNPVEAVVLAHQPIDGATYTAAKLSHLIRIVIYFVPAMNLLPAVAGAMLKGSDWWYPVRHLAAAFMVGFLVALLCCAVYGWLLRLLPAARVKAVGQFLEMMPFLGLLVMNDKRLAWITGALGTFGRYETAVQIIVAALAVTGAVAGLRALSGDYLIRVSSMVRGGSTRASRRAVISQLVARLFGGQAARAAFDFTRKMMLRDWSFRRQALPMLFMMIAPLVGLARAIHVSPFSGKFTAAHFIPHAFGFILFWICTLLVYGTDHKGAWLFLVAPGRVWRPFTRGVYALLWFQLAVMPQALLFVVLAWFWGPGAAALFSVYSLAMSSAWLAVVFRMCNGVPFTKQIQVNRSTVMIPVMMAGALVMGLFVAAQHVFVFRSAANVLIATAVLSVAAVLLTRTAFTAVEAKMRYGLSLLTAESTLLYQEID